MSNMGTCRLGFGRGGPLVVIVLLGVLLGVATAGRAQCPPGFPVDCGTGVCCPAGNTCNTVNTQLCCPAGLPVSCQNTCCPAGAPCSADGSSCGTSCPTGFPVDCGGGICCPGGDTCNTVNAQICCPPGFSVSCSNTCCPAGSTCSADGSSCSGGCPPTSPVDCGNGACCAAGNTCNPMNPQLCCPPANPVPCANTCCPAGSQCGADGASCTTTSNACAATPGFPTDCGNGFCCPGGDRCQSLLVGDVLSEYCCIDLSQVGGSASGALAGMLDSTRVEPQAKRSASTCRKSTKVRPFDVLQVSSGAPFDTAHHQYSVAFQLGAGKKSRSGSPVVLKVPLIADDSNASTLSVMIPPFLLEKGASGKADVFVVTDGTVSDTCAARVRIAKLPKSASRVPGLATLSWLRANQTIYTTARTTLTSAAAAPFITPGIIPDVDAAIASVGKLIPSFDLHGAKNTPLAKTAKTADALVTGMLTAGQKVGDSGFASASRAWVQAMSKARDGNDPALKAAESMYATTVLTLNGASAPSVGKFTVACGSVTSAGIGASAAMVAGGATPSTTIDSKAAANAVCGATVGATAVITGVAAVAAGATTTAGAGATAYGKTLLRGSAQTSASMTTNYGRSNPATTKLCGCQDPAVKGVVDVSITIIVACGHLRQTAPQACLADGHGMPSSSTPTGSTTTTTMPAVGHCNDQQVAGGDTPDTRAIELGKTSGTVQFDYDTLTQPDRIVVTYQGTVLADTGCVGMAGSKSLTYSGTSTQMTVAVTPNCQGGTGTAWNYTLHCPS